LGRKAGSSAGTNSRKSHNTNLSQRRWYAPTASFRILRCKSGAWKVTASKLDRNEQCSDQFVDTTYRWKASNKVRTHHNLRSSVLIVRRVPQSSSSTRSEALRPALMNRKASSTSVNRPKRNQTFNQTCPTYQPLKYGLSA
jgi:hypothetical protein